MAITYNINCPNCDYNTDISVGLTKLEHYKNLPSYELANCSLCKKLVSTNNKACPTCGTKSKTGKWFYKKTGFEILDSSMIRTDSKISCPKCSYKYLKAVPRIFWD